MVCLLASVCNAFCCAVDFWKCVLYMYKTRYVCETLSYIYIRTCNRGIISNDCVSIAFCHGVHALCSSQIHVHVHVDVSHESSDIEGGRK